MYSIIMTVGNSEPHVEQAPLHSPWLSCLTRTCLIVSFLFYQGTSSFFLIENRRVYGGTSYFRSVFCIENRHNLTLLLLNSLFYYSTTVFLILNP